MSIDAAVGPGDPGQLTSRFGFADFVNEHGAVRVARPVAVAETAGGANDETAIVRLRQNGEDNLSLTFYRSTISPARSTACIRAKPATPRRRAGAGLQLARAAARDRRAGLRQLRADRHAQRRCRRPDRHEAGEHTPPATTTGPSPRPTRSWTASTVGHLWNYGLNTWGWEDTHGGGDHDYNDLRRAARFHQRLGPRLARLAL